MLTDTDVHYIVGLLYQVCNPDDVDITLGDMVYNEASETKRDVDITITYKDENGDINAFLGVEVKDHTKPLNSIHVEQLCAKLKTHPEITKGHIVSSNGYTAPSKNVAKFYGIDLWTLKTWNEDVYKFPHASFSKDILIEEISVNWKQWLDTNFVFDRTVLEEDLPYSNYDCLVYDINKQPIEGIQYLHQIVQNLTSNGVNQASAMGQFNSVPLDEETSITLNINIPEPFFILINKNYYLATSVSMIGIIKKTSNRLEKDFKILVKEENNEPLVGCIISEYSNGNLAGVTISSVDNTLRVINIPTSDRVRKKIFEQSLDKSQIVKKV